MKKIFAPLLLFCLIASCTDTPVNDSDISEKPAENVEMAPLFLDSLRSKNKSIPKLNYTNPEGLKQGVWISRGSKNRIKQIETFVDGTLQGYWFKEAGGFQEEGYYEKGHKNGYVWRYRIEDDHLSKSAYNFKIYQEFFYKNDTILWSISPETDIGYLIPVRGLTSSLDSIYARAVYRDGSIWYEGACVDHKHAGTHKVYYPNGKLYGTIDYDTDSVTKYDSLGNLVGTENIRFYRTHMGNRFE